MTMFNKAKNLSLLVLLGAWGCTTNQYVSQSGGYDDLYGNNTGPGVVIGDRGADQDISRSDNPDYAYTGNAGEGTSDYYDESYLSSRSVNRALSADPGYNAGFADGYNRGATAFNNPYGFGGLGSYWPGSMMNVGFQFGYGRIRPYMALGMGYGMGSMLGYSPWGMGSMYGFGYDPFGYNGFGYNGFGYSPWGYNSLYGYGYDSFYGGGYGYNPWAYSRPVVVVNNYESRGLTRTAGPRVVAGTSSRNNSRYNGSNVNSPRTASSERSGRRAAGNSVSANDTYASPRSSRSYNRSGVADANGRAAAGNYSRGGSEGNNVYYSRPRSASSYSSDGTSSGNYTTPRSSRGSGSSSYSVPSRSQSDYTAPSRGNYSTPSRSSESFSAPARTYSTPSYSAPSSRSYSAPSGGGGGGGATRSSSRGPR